MGDTAGSGRVVTVADEGDWLDLLVASERIPSWLETIRFGGQLQKRQALKQLLAEVHAKEAYAEERTPWRQNVMDVLSRETRNISREIHAKGRCALQAKAAGCVAVLTTLISQTGDEEMVEQASSIISACNGTLSGSRKVQEFVYGSHVIRIHEGSLGDGLGARVWVAAHTLCRELSEHPALVQGRRVLELGAGCGLSGLLAAKLGAKEVVLTDYEPKVLLNLRASAAANAATPVFPPAAVAQNSNGGAGPLNGEVTTEVDKSHAAETTQDAAQPSWDLEGVRVRHLDWAEAKLSGERGPFAKEDAIIGRPKEEGDPPTLEAGERFEAILGSDLLYELYHGDLVAAVISSRLETGGSAYISLAVRRQAHLDRLMEQCKANSLLVSLKQVDVDPEAVGIVGREHEYEGGFVFLTVTHQ